MWQVEYQKEFKGVTAKAVWEAWEDVNSWPQWDKELEKTSLTTSFTKGSKFRLKPKGGPNVTIEITEVTPLKTFTDITKFPLAVMHDHHELIETSDGVVIKNRLYVTGPLGWLWKKIVAQGVADGIPAQVEALIAYVQKRETKA